MVGSISDAYPAERKALPGCQLFEGLVLFHMKKEGGTETNELK